MVTFAATGVDTRTRRSALPCVLAIVMWSTAFDPLVACTHGRSILMFFCTVTGAAEISPMRLTTTMRVRIALSLMVARCVLDCDRYRLQGASRLGAMSRAHCPTLATDRSNNCRKTTGLSAGCGL